MQTPRGDRSFDIPGTEYQKIRKSKPRFIKTVPKVSPLARALGPSYVLILFHNSAAIAQLPYLLIRHSIEVHQYREE
jgi:hypothetical protein